jgi:hypothetical protein
MHMLALIRMVVRIRFRVVVALRLFDALVFGMPCVLHALLCVAPFRRDRLVDGMIKAVQLCRLMAARSGATRASL